MMPARTTNVRGRQILRCQKCGVEFSIYNSQVRAGQGTYCSKPCLKLGRNRHDEWASALPGTLFEIAKRMGESEKIAMYALRGMMKAGLAHPSGFVFVDDRVAFSGKQATTLVFSAGPAPRAEIPLNNMQMTLCYFHDQAIIAAMPNTAPAIIRKTGLIATTVRERLSALNDAGRSHIRRWKPAKQGPAIPVHYAGYGINVECNIKPRTKQDRYRRWVTKMTRTGKIIEIKERRKQQRAYRNLRRREGDPLVNALFGAPSERTSNKVAAGE
jgi:hypothetical protein